MLGDCFLYSLNFNVWASSDDRKRNFILWHHESLSCEVVSEGICPLWLKSWVRSQCCGRVPTKSVKVWKGMENSKLVFQTCNNMGSKGIVHKKVRKFVQAAWSRRQNLCQLWATFPSFAVLTRKFQAISPKPWRRIFIFCYDSRHTRLCLIFLVDSLQVVSTLSHLKRHADAQHLMLCGLSSDRFNDASFQTDLLFMSVVALYLNRLGKKNVINNKLNTAMLNSRQEVLRAKEPSCPPYWIFLFSTDFTWLNDVSSFESLHFRCPR